MYDTGGIPKGHPHIAKYVAFWGFFVHSHFPPLDIHILPYPLFPYTPFQFYSASSSYPSR